MIVSAETDARESQKKDQKSFCYKLKIETVEDLLNDDFVGLSVLLLTLAPEVVFN